MTNYASTLRPLLGARTTVTIKSMVGDPAWETSNTGRVVELTDRTVTLTAPPIRGLSSNVKSQISLSVITDLRVNR